MRCVTYKCVLIFIIIKCVKSQDNNPDQPADEEDEEDNFEVLDLDKIIQQRLDRFEDPQYQPQPEPQYQPEPDQYQQVLQYQPETTYYQQELSVYQPQQYDQYQPQHYQSYQAPTHPTGQQYVGYQYYEQSGVSQPGQYYIPPVTQPTQQPSYQNYYPGYPPHQPSYQHQYYEPPVTQPAQQQQYYQPSQPTQTQPQLPQPQYEYYEPTTTQTQQPEQYYDPSHPTQQQHYYEPPHTQTEKRMIISMLQNMIIHMHKKNLNLVRNNLNNQYNHKNKKKKPKKPKRARSPSEDQSEKQGDEQPIKRRGPNKPKVYNEIKFCKIDSDGNLVKMTNEDYEVTYDDRNKTKYLFYADLEQIECDNQIIYLHEDGTPYCSSLTYSKKTKIVVITNIQGFILIKRIKGEWTTTEEKIPEYVKFYTEDSEGKEILLTKEHYKIRITPRCKMYKDKS
ncbi:SVSP family protein [Theileria parva strain Muguga]|uniref:Uncharacterized protein n=1 Tax=Theileria parva TaxID=5875 RepID=Q4N3H6_THEPA|nr:SVSP family protein [Theileria parva strain Muguga]EAN31359.1 SVSP family protein [Theileria parva strain Muguga]|eukprot:XP_763642.1 hypothetical protein [Theileria parva strain Muguga]